MTQVTQATTLQSTSRDALGPRPRSFVLLRSPTLIVGAVILAFWVCCATFGSHLTPYDPLATDMLNVLSPISPQHWFGTDQLGRDVFSRVIVGARDVLIVAPLATLLGVILGTVGGLTTAYFGGIVEVMMSRVVEALLALPVVVVALLALVALGPSNTTVVIVIGVIFAPSIARTVHAAVLSARSLEYVSAAQMRGENALYIMFVEILPNVSAPIVVEAAVRLGYAIFTVASLSFLGFGIQPPSPDWGLAVSESYGLLAGGYWWTVVFDGLATASLVVGVNLIADGLEGALSS